MLDNKFFLKNKEFAQGEEGTGNREANSNYGIPKSMA